MSHAPPPITGTNLGKHPGLNALFKHTYKGQISTKKFADVF